MSVDSPVVTRFAPSPTGELHLGSAYSAWTGWHRAREAGGTFLVRIEDIDIGRCRPEYEAAMMEDLAWLGIEWETPPLRQSERFPLYARALERLREEGIAYPCFCSRSETASAVAEASAIAPSTCARRWRGFHRRGSSAPRGCSAFRGPHCPWLRRWRRDNP